MNHSARMLRGGRITKFKGQAASMSPSIGHLMMSVSSMALLRGLFTGLQRGAVASAVAAAAATSGLVVTTSGAHASCFNPVSPDTFVCSGATNDPQVLSGDPLDVYADNTFTVDSIDNALDLTGTGGLTFEQQAGGLTITGDNSGIVAENNGSGALTITTTGEVIGEAFNGITAENDDGTDLVIYAQGIVRGYEFGINAENDSTGEMRITTLQAVTGTNVVGISAINEGTDLIIDARGEVSSLYRGISALNDGTGELRITTLQKVTGTDEIGIFAWNGFDGTDLTIDAQGEVSGGEDGIYAENNGTGELRITTLQKVTGETGNGIAATNTTYGTNMIIDARGEVSGLERGIYAENDGSGYLKITTYAAVTGTNEVGINATNEGTDLIIDARGEVYGGENGVYALNRGSGELRITTLQAVTGSEDEGIDAWNRSREGTNLIIDARGEVKGGNDGIDAWNNGTGYLKITTHQAVTGTYANGIDALNDNAGTDLIIHAQGTVTGGYIGIKALNDGSGVLRITTEEAVTSTKSDYDDGSNGYGIYAGNRFVNGTDVIIHAKGEVSAQGYGVFAWNYGSGVINITTEKAVTGTDGDGIMAWNEGTDLIITARGDVTGNYTGIYAANEGSGALTITSSGSVTATGTGELAYIYEPFNYDSFAAIFARNMGTDLTIISQGDVTGYAAGIFAYNQGVGETAIDVSGSVFANDVAIQVNAANTAPTSVNLFAGADVSSASGVAFEQAETSVSDTTMTVHTGARIAGDLLFGAGNDQLIFAGGEFSATELLDGRDGVDHLIFSGSSGTITTTNFVNWESVEISNGSEISIPGTQTLQTDILRVLDGGNLSFADGLTDGVFTQAGDFEGDGGMLTFDVDFANSLADNMIIEGDVTGTALIDINPVSFASEPGDSILLIAVEGAVEQTAFALPGGIYETPFYAYALGADIGVDDSSFFLANLFDEEGNPLLSSSASLYEVGAAALLSATQLSGLAARFGGRVPVGQTPQAVTPLGYAASPDLADVLDGANAGGAWMQIEADWQNLAYASTNHETELDSERFNLRFGAAYEHAVNASRLVFGVQGSILWLNNDADFAIGSGSIDSNGFTLGASATWLHDGGFYADAQVEFGQMSSDFASSGFGSLATNVTTGTTAFSFEVGKAFDLTPNSVLIPQAQLQIGRVSTDDFTDSTSTLVSFGDDTSTIGRLGLLYQYSGVGYALFAAANAIQEFSGEQDVEYGGLNFGIDPNTIWGEVEIGGSYAINERSTLFGSASYRTTLGSDGDKGDGAGVSGGLAISF
ncbi:MAG: autotransporter outer membrane beta-barrel domain-containing protein [Pseudomonadota bacterium]